MDTFRIIEKEYIKDIESEAVRMVHRDSGARVLLLKNDNPYKYFNITFMTPPYNSSGIPHILEHCVTAGSRKYPVGSFDKINQSLGLGYLKASTADDHTYYSCMAKSGSDFMNCVDLILDSVFFPLVIKEESIFLREGWRLEMPDDEPEKDFRINGVVLNEIKTSDGDYRMRVDERICKRLMPDSIYHYRAGGKSYKISRSTYADLIDYYDSFYSASNANIFIYGDVDLEELSEILDAYLRYSTRKGKIVIPKTTNNRELIIKKERLHVNRDEYHLYCYSCLFDDKLRPEQALATDFLSDRVEVAVENELCDMGIEGAAFLSLVQDAVQDRLEIIFVSDVENEKKNVYKGIRRALQNTLEADDSYRAGLMGKIYRHEAEFQDIIRSKNTAGEYLYDMVSRYWLYDNDSILNVFRVADNVQYMKNRLWGDMLDTCMVDMLPKEGREILLECFPDNRGEHYFLERSQNEVARQISEMTEEEIVELKQKLEGYEKWSSSVVNNKRVYKKIADSESNRQYRTSKADYKKEMVGGISYYHISAGSEEPVHMTLSFNADLFKEHISELQLLVYFINTGDFNNYGLGATEAKKLLAHSIRADVVIEEKYGSDNCSSDVTIMVDITAIVTEENIPDVLRMIQHMLFDVMVAVPGLKNRLQGIKDSFKDDFYRNPEKYLRGAAGYCLNEACKYLDQKEGLSYYRFLATLCNRGHNALLYFYNNCYVMLNQIFNNDNLTVFCCSSYRGMSLVKKAVAMNSFDSARTEMFSKIKRNYKRAIRNAAYIEERLEYRNLREFVIKNYTSGSIEDWFEHRSRKNCINNTGITILSDINYISFYGKLNKYNYLSRYSGILQIDAKLIEDYLRVELREHGGAYGFAVRLSDDGSIEITSCRDPYIGRTMSIIKGCADFLRTLTIEDNELEMIKQGLIDIFCDDEDEDQRNSESKVRSIAINGLNPMYYDIRLEAIRNCSLKDIRESAELIQEMLDNGVFCVAGSERNLEEYADLFDQIESIDGYIVSKVSDATEIKKKILIEKLKRAKQKEIITRKPA